MRFFSLLFLLAAGLSAATPSNEEIQKILTDRIDTQKKAVGIVVGIIDSSGRRVVAHGWMSGTDKRPVRSDTLFEIGSMTKVFTSLVLADMVERKEVALSDPASKYLPKDVKMPEKDGKAITLLDLATHTSGLPRLPTNLRPADPRDPYADYSAARLYEFLNGYSLTRNIGETYEYSNLGAGLLGQLLTLKAGTDYEHLVRARVLDPLKMKNTVVKVPDEWKGRFATGHDQNLNPVAYWTLDALAGAGALRSDADDMLTFLSAAMGLTKTPLTPAFARMLEVRRPAGGPAMDIGLAWHIQKHEGSEIVWHNGGTGGFRTYFGYNPAAKVGVVVLSNTSTGAGVDDIGRHLLDPYYPLLEPPKARKEIPVDTKILEKYVGKYQLMPNFVLAVTLEDGKLFVQATGQPKFQIFAETEKDFFLKITDAQVTFEGDKLILHQNGQHMPAKRLDQ